MTNSQHYVRQPAFLFFIRIAQILLSIIILGLAAYGIDYFTKDGGKPTDQTEAAFGFAIFVVIYTWIVVGYNLAASTLFIAFWNCWAVLALEIVAVVFWLVSFALLGDWASDYKFMSDKDKYYGDYGLGDYGLGDISLPSIPDLTDMFSGVTKRATISSAEAEFDKAFKKAKGVWQSGAAASGLGAIVWVLFIITLVVYAISLQRHRADPENQNLPADGSPLPDEAHDPNYELKQQSQGYAPQQPA